jgi:LEA14-like dessication related protein
MIKTTLSILALAGACIFLTNCATLFNLEKPEVNLQRVFVRDTSLSGTTLIFVVKVDNPNKQEIKVKEIAYKVFISGKELTQAKTEKPVIVPASGSSEVELPLPIKYTSLFENIGDILLSREVAYKIVGDAKLSFINIPFTKEGKVELR